MHSPVDGQDISMENRQSVTDWWVMIITPTEICTKWCGHSYKVGEGEAS